MQHLTSATYLNELFQITKNGNFISFICLIWMYKQNEDYRRVLYLLKWSAGAYQNVITSVEIGALGRAAHLWHFNEDDRLRGKLWSFLHTCFVRFGFDCYVLKFNSIKSEKVKLFFFGILKCIAIMLFFL